MVRKECDIMSNTHVLSMSLEDISGEEVTPFWVTDKGDRVSSGSFTGHPPTPTPKSPTWEKML